MFSSAVSTLYFITLCKQGCSSGYNLSFNFFANSLLSLCPAGVGLNMFFLSSLYLICFKKPVNIASIFHSVDNFSLTSTSDKRIVSGIFYIMAGSKNVEYI